jgi:hypothetical protein
MDILYMLFDGSTCRHLVRHAETVSAFRKNRLKTRNIRQELGPRVVSGIPPAGRTAT